MKRLTRTLVWAVLVCALAWQPRAMAAERAVCLVCKVTKGEADAEPVKAARSYEGKSYGFCSEKCAKAFEADPAAFVPPSLPRPAPLFALKALSGDTVSNGRLRGKVVLLDFWATWCAPCRKSMPELQALYEKYAGRGFVVVGVSIDQGGSAKVRKYVTSKKFTYPVAIDSEESPAWDAYRVKAVPAAYLIDRDGRIVAQWTGTGVDAHELEARLDELLVRD